MMSLTFWHCVIWFGVISYILYENYSISYHYITRLCTILNLLIDIFTILINMDYSCPHILSHLHIVKDNLSLCPYKSGSSDPTFTILVTLTFWHYMSYDLRILKEHLKAQKHTVKGLQNELTFDILFHFGRRGRGGLRNMKQDSFEFVKDGEGREYARLAYSETW